MYTISVIAKIVSGNMVCTQDANARVEYLLTDSRRLIFPDLTLFFALPGLHRSGNSFIGALMQQTVCNFVVDETFSLNELPSTAANIIKVKDVLQALQQLAAHHRQQFRYPVIGITGSNGKTVVKEWLYQLLNPSFQIIRSPRSYNSQVGVPLSVWQMGPTHELAIFEAGISQAGEMQHLQEIIQPSIGIFTNIGEAHQLGFADRAEKIKEKLKLFSNASIIVYCADQLDVHTAVQALYPSIDALTWSRNGSGVLNINAVSTEGNNSSIRASYKSEDIGMVIPFTDEASIENAIHVWVIMLYLGIPYLVIEERIRHLKPVAMRLELKQGNHACSVINDSYSTDITSLSIA
ncbi:MAG: Mur ligase family protein, partial [Ferruginibacter sp.]